MDNELKPNTTEYKNEFARQKYDRINLVVLKGKKAVYQAFAESCGLSLNALFEQAVIEKMERDRQ